MEFIEVISFFNDNLHHSLGNKSSGSDFKKNFQVSYFLFSKIYFLR